MWHGDRERARMRLPLWEYETPGAICSVTIVVKDRERRFASAEAARVAVNVILETERTQLTPIVEASAKCGVPSFVSRFKNSTQRGARLPGMSGFWQRSYWDDVVRSEGQLEREVRYVLANPVRAGIVSEWREYPFSGSQHFERPPRS
jgi:REP element-mobilizing transposase RayT